MRYDARIHAYSVLGVSHVALIVHDPESRTLTSPPLLRLVFDVPQSGGELTLEDELRDLLVAIIERL